MRDVQAETLEVFKKLMVKPQAREFLETNLMRNDLVQVGEDLDVYLQEAALTLETSYQEVLSGIISNLMLAVEKSAKDISSYDELELRWNANYGTTRINLEAPLSYSINYRHMDYRPLPDVKIDSFYTFDSPIRVIVAYIDHEVEKDHWDYPWQRVRTEVPSLLGSITNNSLAKEPFRVALGVWTVAAYHVALKAHGYDAPVKMYFSSEDR